MGLLNPLENKIAPKLEILEAKFAMYEETSKQMIEKLEIAVEKISDSNNKIATILSKHDEKIHTNVKSEESLLHELETMRLENRELHSQDNDKISETNEKISSKINNIETKLEEFSKFRWIAIGILIVLSFIFSHSNAVVEVLTSEPNSATINSSK